MPKQKNGHAVQCFETQAFLLLFVFDAERRVFECWQAHDAEIGSKNLSAVALKTASTVDPTTLQYYYVDFELQHTGVTVETAEHEGQQVCRNLRDWDLHKFETSQRLVFYSACPRSPLRCIWSFLQVWVVVDVRPGSEANDADVGVGHVLVAIDDVELDEGSLTVSAVNQRLRTGCVQCCGCLVVCFGLISPLTAWCAWCAWCAWEFEWLKVFFFWISLSCRPRPLSVSFATTDSGSASAAASPGAKRSKTVRESANKLEDEDFEVVFKTDNIGIEVERVDDDGEEPYIVVAVVAKGSEADEADVVEDFVVVSIGGTEITGSCLLCSACCFMELLCRSDYMPRAQSRRTHVLVSGENCSEAVVAKLLKGKKPLSVVFGS